MPLPEKGVEGADLSECVYPGIALKQLLKNAVPLLIRPGATTKRSAAVPAAAGRGRDGRNPLLAPCRFADAGGKVRLVASASTP